MGVEIGKNRARSETKILTFKISGSSPPLGQQYRRSVCKKCSYSIQKMEIEDFYMTLLTFVFNMRRCFFI